MYFHRIGLTHARLLVIQASELLDEMPLEARHKYQAGCIGSFIEPL
jgi:hypothetical protein